jgi:hypothetical protein
MPLPKSFEFASFISFAQADKDLDPGAFAILETELEAELARLGSCNKDRWACFLINRYPTGDYRAALEQGKSGSICLLSLYSPNYWASPECTLERDYFYKRNLGAKFRMPQNRQHAEMFAVPWIHRKTDGIGHSANKVFAPNASVETRNLSYYRNEGEFRRVYDRGLLSVLKDSDPTIQDEGRRYIRSIAGEISAVVERVAEARPAPARVGRSATLYVVAAMPHEVQDRLDELTQEQRIKNQLLSFLAKDSGSSQADPEERLQALKDTKVNAYRLGGGEHWHPFSEDLDPSIRSMVQNALQRDVLQLQGANDVPLVNLIAQSQARSEYVIVVIDPWSFFHFSHFRTLLDGVDQRLFSNCMMLVVRPPSDSVGEVQAAEIDEMVTEYFENTRRTWYFREVKSEQDLLTAVKLLLIEIRTSSTQKPLRPVEDGPALPRLQNVGA